MDSIDIEMNECIDMSSIESNEDMSEIKDLMDYMLELVSLSIPSHQNKASDNCDNNSDDIEFGITQTRSQHCIINEDDDEVVVEVKDLVDYMLELVSTAVPFAKSQSTGHRLVDTEDDIQIIDLENETIEMSFEVIDSNDKRFISFGTVWNCFACGKNQIKYEVMTSDKTYPSCSMACVERIKNSRSCMNCFNLICNGSQAYRSNFGPQNSVVCSEACLLAYDSVNEPISQCHNCNDLLLKDKMIYYWQTMEFCSPECVQTKQLIFGSKCAQCQTVVNRQSLGKYSVRFGDNIKQFCIGSCLEAFKKSLKVCAFCQKDLKFCTTICIATFGFGEKMRLREFCDQICKSQYGQMLHSKTSLQMECYQCHRFADNKSVIDFTFNNKKTAICSTTCLSAFKYTNNMNRIFCENCHKYGWTGINQRSKPNILHYSGMTRNFCTKKCMSMFVLKNRKIVACLCCKVKKYNFDLIECYDASNNKSTLFCSLNCLTLCDIADMEKSKLSSNVTKVVCQQCKNHAIPHFFLNIDHVLHKFCSYQCVFQYQRQFAPNSLIALPSNTNPNDSTLVSYLNNGLQQSTMWTPSFFTQNGPRPASMHLSQVSSNILNSNKRINIPLSTVNKTLPSTVSPITTNVVSLPIPSTNTTTSQSVSSSVGSQTIIKEIVKETKEVIVKIPPPKQVRNKCTLFRPPSQTKATSCRPFQIDKEIQTDPPMKVICPIFLPMPIFVPIPVAYMQPLAVPLPLPIPILLQPRIEPPAKSIEDTQQTSFNSDNLNLTDQQIGELLSLPEDMLGENKTVDADVVADILMDENNKRKLDIDESGPTTSKRGRRQSDVTPRGRGRGRGRGGRGGRGRGRGGRKRKEEWETSSEEEEVEEESEDNDTEQEEDQNESSNNSTEDTLQQQQHLLQYQQNYDSVDQLEETTPTRGRGRGRGRGRKSSSTPTPSMEYSVNVVDDQKKAKKGRKKKDSEDGNDGEYDFESQFSTNTTNNGINALRIWLRQSPIYYKTKNILELHQNYLSEIFCKFVEEICQVHGQEYSPDYIYLLCLDLQRHLAENNRLDNIFMDTAYKQFIHAIHSRLVDYNPQLTCISEEKLWECGQLGAHSPTVLLNTVMFLATKFLNMTLLDEHMQFAFSLLRKSWVEDGTQCFVYEVTEPKGRGKRGKVIKQGILYENTENQLRCPVKLFDFYLSKCPEGVLQRRDMFYLYPIEGCVPDSSTWYSSNALTNASVNKMLQRILVVREIVALNGQAIQ